MDIQRNLHPYRPLILAHRGASYQAPENTMAAFRLAAEMGADGIELDVQLCKDGEVVVIHNFAVDETSDGHGRVKDFTLAELQALDAGAWYAIEFAGERIPTLTQVLHELGPRLVLNVEIKTATPFFTDGLEAEVVRLVEDANMVQHVIISSFSPVALWRVRRLNRHISTGLLYAPDLPRYLRDRWLQSLARPAALHPRWDMLDEQTIAAAHRHGLAVRPWTCDDPDALRRLVGWGVDAIITNQPDLLRDLLQSTF
jgi:glycerophosphoryl diester phosphodiesterase